MKRSRYYIRVQPDDYDNFLIYMERNNIEGTMLSADFMSSGGSMMMSLQMNAEEACALRLSFGLIGFINFNRTLDRQVARTTAKINLTTPDTP